MLRAKGAETDPARAHALERLGARRRPARTLVRFVRDEVFPFYTEVAGALGDELHGRRPARHRRADRADPGRRPGRRAAPRPGGCGQQGRSVRARPEADQAGGRAGPVPHAPAHHPRDRRDGRSEDRRDGLRPGCRHSGLPGRRLQPHPPRELLGRWRSRRSRSTARSQRRGHGDRLSDAQFRMLQNETFYGNDVDARWSASRP